MHDAVHVAIRYKTCKPTLANDHSTALTKSFDSPKHFLAFRLTVKANNNFISNSELLKFSPTMYHTMEKKRDLCFQVVRFSWFRYLHLSDLSPPFCGSKQSRMKSLIYFRLVSFWRLLLTIASFLQCCLTLPQSSFSLSHLQYVQSLYFLVLLHQKSNLM